MNAEDLFAKDQSTELRNAIKQLRDTTPSATYPKEENLALYRSVKADTYSKLSASEKEKWEALANKHNERIQHLPPMEHIHK
jgi:hypothetical protein